MTASKLQELERMASKLLTTARQISPGAERHDILREIGRFRVAITKLQLANMGAGNDEQRGHESSAPLCRVWRANVLL